MNTSAHDYVNLGLLGMIPRDARNVIEIGCSLGALAREYKKINPSVNYVGVEIDPGYVEGAEKYCDRVINADIETAPADFWVENSHRDCWIFGDCLEHLRDPWGTLKKIRSILPQGGCVVACIPNAQYWKIQLWLSLGEFRYADAGILDRTHLRWFTRKTILELFVGQSYGVVACFPRYPDDPEFDKFIPVIEQVSALTGSDSATNIEDARAYQYLIKAIPN